MPTQPVKPLTPRDYLTLERQSEYKSEYVDGVIVAMAGASQRHNLVITNVVRELSTQLKHRQCEVYPSDMRVRIPRLNTYTYPDVAVVCGKPKFEDDHRDTLLNPTIIIEVLSPSTETYDRTDKFKHYRTLEALQEYVLINLTRPWIENYVRQEGSRFWTFSDAEGVEAQIELTSVGCQLLLAEVYDKVGFEDLENTR